MEETRPMKQRIWFDRAFQLGLASDAFLEIRERVRGTPARLEEKLRTVAPSVLARRHADGWSPQEHAGHLLDLEPLWEGRLDDLLAGRERLRPADLTNRKTHEARHNDRGCDEILMEFRRARMAIVARLDAIEDEALQNSALHPRLEQPMTITDLFFFVAEHDDHHLATIHRLLG
jgi:uncharacterized damage-inducible protein DinB